VADERRPIPVTPLVPTDERRPIPIPSRRSIPRIPANETTDAYLAQNTMISNLTKRGNAIGPILS